MPIISTSLVNSSLDLPAYALRPGNLKSSLATFSPLLLVETSSPFSRALRTFTYFGIKKKKLYCLVTCWWFLLTILFRVGLVGEL